MLHWHDTGLFYWHVYYCGNIRKVVYFRRDDGTSVTQNFVTSIMTCMYHPADEKGLGKHSFNDFLKLADHDPITIDPPTTS